MSTHSIRSLFGTCNKFVFRNKVLNYPDTLYLYSTVYHQTVPVYQLCRSSEINFLKFVSKLVMLISVIASLTSGFIS